MSRYSPRDMPALRDELAAFERANPRDADWEMRAGLQLLYRRASLWWVSPDMTRLAQQAAPTIPTWSIDLVAPDQRGLIVWAGDALKLPVGGMPTPLRGVLWQLFDGLFYAAIFTDDPTPAPGAPRLFEAAGLEISTRTPLDRIPGDPAFQPVMDLLGTTWSMMQQPYVDDLRQERVERTPNPLMQAAPRAPQVDDVQIIDLRPRPRRDTEKPTGDGGRVYHSRWVVRGHWRQQAVGPGRTQRRPVYVAPYVKGPEGAPLKDKKVHVWRR